MLIQSKFLKKDMAEIITKFKIYNEDERNIYGVSIRRSKVRERFLITTRKTIAHYPDNMFLYQIIDTLNSYISKKDAIPENFPMLYIGSIGKNHFDIIVAIPVNKNLENKNDIVVKQMMPGNILIAEVTGGYSSVRKTFETLEHYIQDHQLNSPAIPYQLLVTNRLLERDSSKWLTGIYYPIY